MLTLRKNLPLDLFGNAFFVVMRLYTPSDHHIYIAPCMVISYHVYILHIYIYINIYTFSMHTYICKYTHYTHYIITCTITYVHHKSMYICTHLFHTHKYWCFTIPKHYYIYRCLYIYIHNTGIIGPFLNPTWIAWFPLKWDIAGALELRGTRQRFPRHGSGGPASASSGGATGGSASSVGETQSVAVEKRHFFWWNDIIYSMVCWIINGWLILICIKNLMFAGFVFVSYVGGLYYCTNSCVDFGIIGDWESHQ